MSEFAWRRDQDLDEIALGFPGCLAIEIGHAITRIVHKRVNTDAIAVERPNQLGATLDTRQIRGHGTCFHPMHRAQFLRQRVEPVGAAPRQHHIETMRCENSGQCSADAGGRAGDQCRACWAIPRLIHRRRRSRHRDTLGRTNSISRPKPDFNWLQSTTSKSSTARAAVGNSGRAFADAPVPPRSAPVMRALSPTAPAPDCDPRP